MGVEKGFRSKRSAPKLSRNYAAIAVVLLVAIASLTGVFRVKLLSSDKMVILW